MPEKLAKKFIAITVVLVAVSLGLGIFFIRQTYFNIFTNVNTEIGQSARIVAFEQNSWVERSRQFLEVLSVIPELAGDDLTECSKLLTHILKVYPQYVNLGVEDLQGNLICSGLPIAPAVNFRNESWFRGVLKTKDFSVGDFQVGPISGKPVIIFGHPIFDSKANLKRVIAVGLDLGWVHGLLHEIELKKGSVAYMIDRNGIILASAFAEEEPSDHHVGEKFFVEEFLGHIINSDAHTFNATGEDGILRIYASTPLPREGGNDLYFIFGVPLKNIAAETAKVALPFLIIIIIGVLVLRDVFFHHQKEAMEME